MTTHIPSPQAASVTMEQIFRQAVGHHQGGRLEEAAELYRSILETDPDHAEANHNMGALAVQVSQPAGGLPYFVAALNVAPERRQYWLSYIDALFQAGEGEDARQILALARQQGLAGNEVDALVLRLEGNAAAVGQSDAENPKVSGKSAPVSPADPERRRSKAQAAKPEKGGGTPGPRRENNPGHQEINTLVALFTEGRLPEAAVLAQVMTEQFPQHEFGWKALGAVFKQMGRSAEALIPMQKAAALSPGDVEAHYNLGVTLQGLGRLDEAESSYRQALQINPNYAEAHSNLGVILQELGRLDEAEASYRRALQINPNHAKAHSNLGAILQKLGRRSEAEASYRQALQIDQANAETHSNLGNTLRELGRLDEAEVSYRRALEINPDFVEAHSDLGNTLKDRGRLEEAETCYRHALEIKPDYAEAHYNLGNILMNLGRSGEAEASYRRALEIRPDYAEVHSNLGNALKALGRLAEAEASYRRALKQNPGFAEAHYNMANVLMDLSRLGEAEASYRRALDAKSDYAEAHCNLGNVLMDLGRLDEAEVSYRRAFEIKPDYAEAHCNLGNLLKDMGRLDEAEASCRHALKIKPGYAEAHYMLSKVLFAASVFDEALHSYRAATPHTSIDQISVSDILGVKEFCERAGAPYHLISAPHDASIAMPKYIGEKFDAATGVTQSNELYVAELSRATILGKHSVIISGRDTALYDNLVHPLGDTVDLRFEWAIKTHAHMKALIDQSSFRTGYAERGIHLSGASSDQYGHWILEHLPKIKLFDALPQYDSYPIYVDAAMPPSHYLALELLTQGRREIVVVSSDTSVEFEKLVVASTFTFFPFVCKPDAPPSIHQGSISAEGATFLRDRLLSALGLSPDPLPAGRRGRRIFIGRRHKARALVNQIEIQQLLSANGFEIIYPEELTYTQQIEIFNESEYVFGPNGSAFCNVIFCKKNTKVASFVQSYGSNFSAWAEVVEQLDHHHLYVAGNPIPATSWHEHHFDYVIPLSLVKQALDYFGLPIVSG